MRIGTKILLLMLLMAIGSSAMVSWVVTMNLTRHETARANDQISAAIGRYGQHLDREQEQIGRTVRAMLEAPAQRSLLQAAGDGSDASAREQLRQEVLGRDVQMELQSSVGSPAFQLLMNLAHEVVVVSSADARLPPILASDATRWPVDSVLDAKPRPVIRYISTSAGLFLAMGVPLHTQLDEPPDYAYFCGFRVDDDWVRRQLIAEQAAGVSTSAPLAAWFVVDGTVVASASSDSTDARIQTFGAGTALRPVNAAHPTIIGGTAERVDFDLGGEHYLGQSFPFDANDAKAGRLVLASSLDKALAPLHRLQRQIMLTAVVACLIAIIACRAIASIIARPIGELVAGTRRIADGQFDAPVRIKRRDELGTLADSFNQMAQGLKERDGLREDRIKLERDLALARKIQMDVLPKELPACPGYDLAAFSLPAEQTGGDIYDLIAIAIDPPDAGKSPSLVLLLADATGHGIGPALSVTQVRAMLRIGVRLRADLEDVFSQINRQLCQDLGCERFVTAFLGLLDPAAHCINYHSAGQAPLLHFHAQAHQFEWLDASMVPLGIDDDARSDSVRLMRMDPGDLVVLLTDGFYEYQNPDGQLLGKERIGETIMRHHHRPARELLDEILNATRAFGNGSPQHDDMTGVIVRRMPAK